MNHTASSFSRLMLVLVFGSEKNELALSCFI